MRNVGEMGEMGEMGDITLCIARKRRQHTCLEGVIWVAIAKEESIAQLIRGYDGARKNCKTKNDGVF
jgi:hypothetical protein